MFTWPSTTMPISICRQHPDQILLDNSENSIFHYFPRTFDLDLGLSFLGFTTQLYFSSLTCHFCRRNFKLIHFCSILLSPLLRMVLTCNYPLLFAAERMDATTAIHPSFLVWCAGSNCTTQQYYIIELTTSRVAITCSPISYNRRFRMTRDHQLR